MKCIATSLRIYNNNKEKRERKKIMHGSKFDNDPDDDCSCEEIIVSRQPKPSSYHSRRKDTKKTEDTIYRKMIDKFDPCVCPEENLRYIESIDREMIKPLSSTLKDTCCEIDMDNLIKKKRNKNRMTTKKRSKAHRTNELCDKDCSIIYCNKFRDDEQLQEHLCPFKATRTQENIEWTEGSGISICTFPIIEKQSVCDGTFGKIEGKFDRRDVKSKDPFFDIPSIPPCDLPDLVERKPEPEVLATVLLLSEKDDLREAKPNVIFDKLFLNSTSRRNFTTDMNDEVADHKTTNTDDDPVDPGLDDAQVKEFGEEHEETDTTRYRSLPQNWKENTREKWTKDDMLEYMMKMEVTPSYKNYVRLNGSVKPSWFPGYALVSPLIPDCIRITSDPGEALLEAWRLCRPRHFDEFSKSFLNTA